MKSKRNINFIMALAFMIPAIILFTMLGFHFSRKFIILTGTETQAQVVSYSSNVTENDVELYKLKFLFFDENGNVHYGETSSKYLYEEARNKETVLIRYNSNFKAVEADYKLNGVKIIWFCFLGVFTLVDVCIWVAFFKDVKQKKIDKILTTSGYDATAEFLPMETLPITINGVPYYKIKYKYTDHNGIEHIVKDRNFYTYPQIAWLSQNQNFSIKEDGKNSTIVEEIKTLNTNSTQQTVEMPKPKIKKECMYCGAVVEEDCNFCPKCGSNKFKKIK